MSFFSRGLFVVTGIIVGSTALNHFVFGNTADFGLPNARLGEFRQAHVRPACYAALESPKTDAANPAMPYGQHRVSYEDHDRAVVLTAALHCYLVTQNNAVCQIDNRAYVTDYIKKYFAKIDEMQATAKRYGDDEVRNVRALWNSANNRAVMSALDNHIRYGRLKKSDFGWSAPAALTPLFDKYPDAPDACAKERPWAAVKL